MKKFICLLCTSLICVLFCSCGSPKIITENDLTDKDYGYIDAVYGVMSEWDTTCRDGSENYHINKISF